MCKQPILLRTKTQTDNVASHIHSVSNHAVVIGAWDGLHSVSDGLVRGQILPVVRLFVMPSYRWWAVAVPGNEEASCHKYITIPILFLKTLLYSWFLLSGIPNLILKTLILPH